MVSLSISSPKTPPLSYADRAKKAQNIRSPNSVHQQRSVVQSVTTPTSSSSTVSSPPLPSSHEELKPNTNSSSIICGSSHVLSSNSLDDSSPIPPTGDALVANPPDATQRASNNLANRALSIVAAHTTPQASSAVNTWSTFKEQQPIAVRSTPHHNSLQNSTSHDMPSPPTSVIFEEQASLRPSLPSHSPRDPTSKAGTGPSATTSLNGRTLAPLPVEHDPFVVRIYAKQAHVQIPLVAPPVIDSDNWPEVGESVPSSTLVRGGVSSVERTTSKGDVETRSNKGEKAPSNNNRKSEKTKWVAIPPEELQATADALTKSSRRQFQSGKDYVSPTSHSGKNTNHNSGSGSTPVHGRSRVHSTSHSVSHSRTQSRPESVQSSPHAIRGRRLPDDGIPPMAGAGAAGELQGSSGDIDITTRSSGLSSPHLAQSHLQPPQLQTHQPAVYDGLSPAANRETITHPIPIYSPGQTFMQSGISQHGGQPSSGPSHYMQFGTHTSGRSYHSHDSTPPLPQSPEYPLPAAPRQPPFPMYPPPFRPNDYHTPNSATHYQLYGFWNGHSHPGSGYQSPVYPPPSQHYGHLKSMQSYPQPYPSQNPYSEGSASAESSMVDGAVRSLPSDQSSAVVGNFPTAKFAGISAEDVREGEKSIHVVFGSIGIPEASQCPSPAPLGHGAMSEQEKPFAVFSIGVPPGDVNLPRSRSRTHSGKARSRTITVSDAGSLGVKKSAIAGGEVANITDLTDLPEMKWVFGTATAQPLVDSRMNDAVAASSLFPLVGPHVDAPPSAEPRSQANLRTYEPLPPVLATLSGFGSPITTSKAVSGALPSELYTHLEQLSTAPTEDPIDPSRDIFEVKDFGYGFGSASRGSISPPEQQNGGEIKGVEQDDRGQGWGYRVNERRDMEAPIRPRRGGGYYGGYGHERGGYDRGGFSGRRERGTNGFGRGYRRGGYQQPPHRPPFSVTPPATHFQPLIPMGDPSQSYRHNLPHRPHLTTYIPTGFEGYLPPSANQAIPQLTAPHITPPVPVPISPITFPLDATRWYLLGQLEYYLSPQNMAQDFFLRQQIDSRGWVPISLIASFNRIRQLTMDEQLVRDVLVLSSVVQVKDAWVRMNGWEQFVLPDAAPSNVESSAPQNQVYEGGLPHQGADSLNQDTAREADMGADIADHDDDSDEDVVFVMHHEN